MTFFYLLQLSAMAQQDSIVIKNDIPKAETTSNQLQQQVPVKIQKINDSSNSKQIFDTYRLNTLKTPTIDIKKNTTIAALPILALDSLKKLIEIDSTLVKLQDSILLAKKIENNYSLLQTNPILKNNSFEYQLTNFKKYESKDYLFYLLLGVSFILALVQAVFPKYLKNIFDIFFQPSFRQRQTREQLTQEYFAIFLLNILFVLSTSIFLTLISTHQIQSNKLFWQFLFLSILTLSIIYTTKYSFTRFIGWVFNQQSVAESYNFLTFLINKIIGVVLVPLIFLISYSSTELKEFSITVSFIIIALLLFYRFIRTVTTLRQLLKVSGFHFFIYFCSVEILPLFILYKTIGKYIGNGI